MSDVKNEKLISEIVSRVMAKIAPKTDSDSAFDSVDAAVAASERAQKSWQWDFSLEERSRIINGIRTEMKPHLESLAAMALEETGMGRLDDKIIKKHLALDKTPGVEDFKTHAISGDHGLVLEEYSPFGVIASITPSTNPIASVINNTIAMIAGGNGIVFAPHPGAVKSTMTAGQCMHDIFLKFGGPSGLFTVLSKPSMDNLSTLMKHPSIRLIAATGGPGVVHAALTSGKPAIGAGPGNPPVIVDETANIEQAAKDVIMGCSFDNNLPCIAEKELFVVNCVADQLKKKMVENGAYELRDQKLISELEKKIITEKGVNRRFVGKSVSWILSQIGIKVGEQFRIILIETDASHHFVQEELLMPVLPMVRMPDFDAALTAALQAEHGYRHSAIIHSTNINNMSRMARAMETTIFTKNAPSFASIGAGGESPTAFTIATTTGQGPTTPRSFCRVRRCVLNGAFRII